MKKVLFMACFTLGTLGGFAMASGGNQYASEVNANLDALNAEL